MASKKLVATPDMKSVVEQLIKSHRITQTAYEYAKANGYEDQDVIRLAERQRAIKAHMELGANPSRCSPRENEREHNAPTPHRSRKAEGWRRVPSGNALGAPLAYKERTVLDQYGDKYELDIRFALERFMQDAEYAQSVRTADLNPTGGGTPGKRLGGLGNVHDRTRLAHARHQWIIPHLSEEAKITADALLLREMKKPGGTPFSMEEFGGYILPSVIDKNRRWGVSAGALWQLGGQLVHLYSRCPYRVAWDDEEDRPFDTLTRLER